MHGSRARAIPESFWKIQEGSRRAWRTRILWRHFQSTDTGPNEPSELLKGKRALCFRFHRIIWEKWIGSLWRNFILESLVGKHAITWELDLPEIKGNFASFFFFLRKTATNIPSASFDTHSKREVTITPPSCFVLFCFPTSEEWCEKVLWKNKGLSSKNNCHPDLCPES